MLDNVLSSLFFTGDGDRSNLTTPPTLTTGTSEKGGCAVGAPKKRCAPTNAHYPPHPHGRSAHSPSDPSVIVFSEIKVTHR